MLEAVYSKLFIKEVEKSIKRGKNIEKIKTIIKVLLDGKQLPAKNRNHKLKGEFKDCWECHIEPDWLLIYKKTETAIVFIRTGTHADLF